MATQLKTPSVKDQVSAEEWALRVDLAAAYRLVAHYGWDDLIFTHLSVRVPGPVPQAVLKSAPVLGAAPESMPGSAPVWVQALVPELAPETVPESAPSRVPG